MLKKHDATPPVQDASLDEMAFCRKDRNGERCPDAPCTRIVRVAETLLCGGRGFSRGVFDRSMALFFGDYATAVHSPNYAAVAAPSTPAFVVTTS
jgi:hypothetical protein